MTSKRSCGACARTRRNRRRRLEPRWQNLLASSTWGLLRKMLKPRTPKLPGEPRAGTRSWYRYYAGFSADFVRDVLGDLGLGADGLVIDPWNGSGTTTAVADELGVRAWGGDINPAMVVIAKARLLGWRVRPSEISLCDAIIESSRSPGLWQSGGDEPLRSWFRGEAASQ